MFSKDDISETTDNPAGVSFHELTTEEMLLTSGGIVLKPVMATALITAVVSAVSGVFSHRHC